LGNIDNPEKIQRWTAKRKSTLVLTILKGKISAAEAARKHGLTIAEVERWRDQLLFGAKNALQSTPETKAEYVKRLERKVRQIALDMDIMNRRQSSQMFFFAVAVSRDGFILRFRGSENSSSFFSPTAIGGSGSSCASRTAFG
jgi:transposase-like protein